MVVTHHRKAADATVGAVVAAVLALIGPYVSTYLPVVGAYTSTRLPLSLPVWGLSSLALLAALLVVGGLAQFSGRRKAEHRADAAEARAIVAEAERVKAEARAVAADERVAGLEADKEQRERRALAYPWGGALWPLTENFWSIVLRTSAADFSEGRADTGLLNSAIGDPICVNPKCHREIWRYITKGKCEDCGRSFSLGLVGIASVSDTEKFKLKLEVYREARAEYLRQQRGERT